MEPYGLCLALLSPLICHSEGRWPRRGPQILLANIWLIDFFPSAVHAFDTMQARSCVLFNVGHLDNM